jgi:hypothetical protein
MGWKQVKETMSPACLEYISRLNIDSDVKLLAQQLDIREECVRNFKIANIVLKTCAAWGLSLHQIGEIMYRPGYGETTSVLEQIVEKSECLYFEVRKRLLD